MFDRTTAAAPIRAGISPVALAVACLFVMGPAAAYEEHTHSVLTTLAYQRSAVGQNPSLLTGFGLHDPTLAIFTLNDLGMPTDKDASNNQLLYVPTVGKAPTNAAGVLFYGAAYEDEVFKSVAFDHFWDPQFNGGAGRGLSVPGIVPLLLGGGIASPDWVLEDNGQAQVDPNGHTPGGVHGFSARIAGQQYYAALTASDPASRLAAESLMWQSLGHVAHHIEDMAQPQHVRNEPHLHGPNIFPLPGNREFPPGISRYELFTLYRDDNDIAALVNDPANRYTGVGPQFSRMRDYFQMGVFTATNFTTMSSEFSFNSNGTYGPNSSFPLPDGSKVTGLTAVTAPDTFLGFQYKQYYLSETMSDAYGTGTNLNIKMARTCNLMQMFRAQTGDTKTPCLVPDDNVYADWNRVLLPRSVAFVQGMIDHFFRGRLTLAAIANPNNNGVVDGKVWRIKDASGNQLSGMFELYSEDGAGSRSRVWSSVQGIAGSGSLTATLTTSPAPAPKLVAVFHGMVGVDGDQGATLNYYEVEGATATVPYPPPPPPPPPPAPPPPCQGAWQPGALYQSTSMTYSPVGGPSPITFGWDPLGTEVSFSVLQDSKVVYQTGVVTYLGNIVFQSNGDPIQIVATIPNQPGGGAYNYAVVCGALSTPALPREVVSFINDGNTCAATWTVSIDGSAPISLSQGGYVNATLSRSAGHRVTTTASWQGTCGGADQTSPGAIFIQAANIPRARLAGWGETDAFTVP